MTTRQAELLMGIVTALLSLGLMIKAYELPIGYIEGDGPAAGAFPFWLGAGMLSCSIWTLVRWYRRSSAPSRSAELFMDRQVLVLVGITAVSLAVMIALVSVIGMYGAVLLYLVFYLRVVGRHGWPLVLAISLSSPIVMFVFFEILLTITLPKGLSRFEELYYPLFDFFYD